MIYIGTFYHVTVIGLRNETDHRHGEFNLIVSAPDPEAAQILFKNRIGDFIKQGSIFEGRCRIFLTQLLEFKGIPEEKAVLINFKSIAGMPAMPHIECALPTDESDGCRIFEWSDNVPEIEGMAGKLFAEMDAG